MRKWRNWQTRTFEGRVGNRTGSSPVFRIKNKRYRLVSLIFLLNRNGTPRARVKKAFGGGFFRATALPAGRQVPSSALKIRDAFWCLLFFCLIETGPRGLVSIYTLITQKAKQNTSLPMCSALFVFLNSLHYIIYPLTYYGVCCIIIMNFCAKKYGRNHE